MLDNIKARRIARFLKKNASNQSGGSLEEAKRPKTPAFVRHCVTAITQDPQELGRVEKKGSPFAICWSKYKQDKRSLAAKHSKGKHHTIKDYKKALKKLRQETKEIRRSRPSRSQIVFESSENPKGRLRALIKFVPEG